MRKAFIACILTSVCFVWGEGPEPKPNKTPGSAGTANHAKPERGSPENPIVVDTQGHKETDIERNKAEKQASEAKTDKDFHNALDISTRYWTAFAAIATGILVLVGIGGTIAAVCTIRAIEKQSGIQGRSIDLQERAMAQWVEMKDNLWSVEHVLMPVDGGPLHSLKIKTTIINPTDFPVTITHTGITAGNIGIETQFGTAEYFIPPNGEYELIITLVLGPEHAAEYIAGKLMLPISGTVTHYGRLGPDRKIIQPFKGILQCALPPHRSHFTIEVHMNPKAHTKNPN